MTQQKKLLLEILDQVSLSAKKLYKNNDQFIGHLYHADWQNIYISINCIAGLINLTG